MLSLDPIEIAAIMLHLSFAALFFCWDNLFSHRDASIFAVEFSSKQAFYLQNP